MYRADSWIRHAEKDPLDDDDRFIALWIAFNALYGQADSYLMESTKPSEMQDVRTFVARACQIKGSERRFLRGLEAVGDDVRILCESPFLYIEYWGSGFTDALEGRLQSLSGRAAPRNRKALVQFLGDLFERIYVLRNQILHGSATYGSGANRGTLEPALRVLRELVPLLRTLVDESDSAVDWGRLPYPAKGRPDHPPDRRTM